jgi:hypothetical protein
MSRKGPGVDGEARCALLGAGDSERTAAFEAPNSPSMTKDDMFNVERRAQC